ncbi:hypothetical protein G4V62_17365 [Bacillaceae bacterium SIJ1]|uniref:YuiB family protein n=1 Tax=Litoribacterium kuwaitense TaxID=1398745 RepID=UPI0013EC4019|nr:YuiB family protein [Litoribacterium kuwaitense]NGP46627.1 hypothetical protein [Litoribacterium kuwaitense]
MSIPVVIISMLLFLILFFGIGFLLNMLLRKTWVMAFIYPLIVMWIVGNVSLTDYFTQPSNSFASVYTNVLQLQSADILILGTGFVGTIVAGIVIRLLRKMGYQMF